MKVNKLNEKQAGSDYEAASTAHLNDEFAEYDNIEFEQAGENNSLVSDILVKKDNQDKFYIECKDTTTGAQAGEFGVKLNDGKLSLIRKTHDMDTALGIIEAVNSSIDVDEITTGTIKLIDIPGVRDLAEQRIYNIYKHDKNTEYIMAPGNIRFNIASIKDWNKLLRLKEVNLRWKANNSSNISAVAQREVLPFIEDKLKAKNIKLLNGSKLLFDSDVDIPNYYSFETDSGRAFLVTLVSDDRDGAYTGTTQKYQIRTPGGRGIIIFTLGMNNPNFDEIGKLKQDLGVNEGLDMRQNLSEELIINDDISLGSLDHDDEECKKELAKEIEKNEKEVSDELADRVEEVEEINNAEAPELELHDANDKKIKIKGLTEKLILEEPEDMLNEDFGSWTEDTYMDKYFTAVHDVYSVLYNFIRDCGDYMHEAGENQLDAAESICDEAVTHFEQALDEFGNLTEEVLDEKIPNDLAKAYKKYNYRGRSGGNTDLENATYTVIDDPAEAYKLYKQDPKSIRLLFGNDLIDFRDDGRPSDVHRDTWLGNGKEFVNRNGKVVRDSMYVPPKELIKRADKIYVTNEHTPEGKKDPAKLSARRENPESPNSNVASNLRNYSYGKRHYWNNDERRGDASRSDSYDRRSLNNYKDTLQGYERRLAQADQSGDYGWRGRDRMVQDIEDARQNVFNQQGRIKDNAARRRYANSELALQKPLERFVELKGNINRLQDMVDDSARDLETAKREGSPNSRRNKEKLRELQQDMLELRKRIAAVELDLEETDEEDAKAIEAAERKYSSAQSEYDNARAEIDRLLRRNN